MSTGPAEVEKWSEPAPWPCTGSDTASTANPAASRFCFLVAILMGGSPRASQRKLAQVDLPANRASQSKFSNEIKNRCAVAKPPQARNLVKNREPGMQPPLTRRAMLTT